MTGTIYEQLMAERGQYHQRETTSTPGDPVTVMRPLVTAIETEIANSGHEISQDIHDALSKHLTIANALDHAAQIAADLQNNTWVQLGEKYAGLPAPVIAAATHAADVVASDLAAIVQPAA